MSLPVGSTIGFLGGGQLGRMMAVEARRLGYKVAVLDAHPNCPARVYADVFVQSQLSDPEGIAKLAQASDLVTLETEHVPAELLEPITKHTDILPKPSIFHTVQDRLRQRQFLESIGAPQPHWAHVRSASEIQAALNAWSSAGVLKTRHGGYDGKGQERIMDPKDAKRIQAAHASIEDGVLESFVPFDLEFSILLARATDGTVKAWPAIRNEHRGGILHISSVPSQVDDALTTKATEVAMDIITKLDHVGTMAVEFFAVGTDVLVNEIAPRVHNSGHFSLGGSVTNQFEQHVRAIAGLPLGDTDLLRPTAMLNVLGDLWADGEPDWSAVLKQPGTTVHLYSKQEARPGRKMGHVTILADEVGVATQRANAIFDALA